MPIGNIKVRCKKCGSMYISGDCVRFICSICAMNQLIEDSWQISPMQKAIQNDPWNTAEQIAFNYMIECTFDLIKPKNHAVLYSVDEYKEK